MRITLTFALSLFVLGLVTEARGTGSIRVAGTSQTAASPLPVWMAGCWAGEDRGERFSERWIQADAATLLGVAHTTRASTLSAFEFLRVIVRDNRPVYVAQPGGAPPTEFVADSIAGTRVIFENHAHDFPKRVIYERTGDDRLVASIDAGQESGKRMTFAMRREPCDR